MATKKTSNKRKSTTTKTSSVKQSKQKKATSKQITHWIFAITVAFFIFCCFMILRTDDLSPIEYLADIIKLALPIGIIAYMYRAVMTDKMELQLKYSEEASKLKQTYGDDYVSEELGEPDFIKRS